MIFVAALFLRIYTHFISNDFLLLWILNFWVWIRWIFANGFWVRPIYIIWRYIEYFINKYALALICMKISRKRNENSVTAATTNLITLCVCVHHQRWLVHFDFFFGCCCCHRFAFFRFSILYTLPSFIPENNKSFRKSMVLNLNGRFYERKKTKKI